ncbi:MAG: hypothetical protein V1797_08100 [Pseudomonadota bacterium]
MLLMAGLGAGLVLAGPAWAGDASPAAAGLAEARPPLVVAESVLNQEPKPRPLRVGASEPAAPAAPVAPAKKVSKKKKPASATKAVKTHRAKAAKKSAAKAAAKSKIKTKKVKKAKR